MRIPIIDMTPWIVIAVLVVVALVVVLLMVRKMRGRGLTPAAASRLLKEMNRALVLHDANRKVLETEKVFDEALKQLGFKGTFADKLRKVGPRLGNEQAVWNAHKLRNRIAHEVGVHVSDSEASSAAAVFKRELERLC